MEQSEKNTYPNKGKYYTVVSNLDGFYYFKSLYNGMVGTKYTKDEKEKAYIEGEAHATIVQSLCFPYKDILMILDSIAKKLDDLVKPIYYTGEPFPGTKYGPIKREMNTPYLKDILDKEK